MEENEDCDDYTDNDKTKKEIKTAVDAVVEGGLKSDLKLKPNKTVTIKVCQVDKPVTTKDIDLLVDDSKEAKDVINKTTVQIIKTPKQDPISKETCAACSYRPKKGHKTDEVLNIIKTLEKKKRRALRMLATDEATTSTGETNLIVPGDDDSVADDPYAAADGDGDNHMPDHTMLYVGIVFGCLCVMAIAAAMFLVARKKKRAAKAAKGPAIAYTPMQPLQLFSFFLQP
jgi:hypothetical protein